MKYWIPFLMCSTAYGASLSDVPYRQWYETRQHVHNQLGKPDKVIVTYCDNDNLSSNSTRLQCEIDEWHVDGIIMQASYTSKNELIHMQYHHVPYMWTEGDNYTVLEPYKDTMNESSKEWRKTLIPKRFKNFQDWWTW